MVAPKVTLLLSCHRRDCGHPDCQNSHEASQPTAAGQHPRDLYFSFEKWHCRVHIQIRIQTFPAAKAWTPTLSVSVACVPRRHASDWTSPRPFSRPVAIARCRDDWSLNAPKRVCPRQDSTRLPWLAATLSRTCRSDFLPPNDGGRRRQPRLPP